MSIKISPEELTKLLTRTVDSCEYECDDYNVYFCFTDSDDVAEMVVSTANLINDYYNNPDKYLSAAAKELRDVLIQQPGTDISKYSEEIIKENLKFPNFSNNSVSFGFDYDGYDMLPEVCVDENLNIDSVALND